MFEQTGHIFCSLRPEKGRKAEYGQHGKDNRSSWPQKKDDKILLSEKILNAATIVAL
jgi:hypothetical protein